MNNLIDTIQRAIIALKIKIPVPHLSETENTKMPIYYLIFLLPIIK